MVGTSTGDGLVRTYEQSIPFFAESNAALIEGTDGSRAGTCVSLDAEGNYLAVSAPYSGTTGLVTTYTWNAGRWEPRGSPLSISDGDMGSEFGRSLALSDDGMVVAVAATRPGSAPGAIYVYEWLSFIQLWSLRGSAIVGPSDTPDFGARLLLSDDGRVLAASSPNHQERRGMVAVYAYDRATRLWEAQGVPFVGVIAGDARGTGMALAGNGFTIVFSDPGQNSVFAFAWNSEIWVPLGAVLTLPRDVGSNFGRSLGLMADGTLLAVSSTQGFLDQGAITLYMFADHLSLWVEGETFLGFAPTVRIGESEIRIAPRGEFLVAAAEASLTSTVYSVSARRLSEEQCVAQGAGWRYDGRIICDGLGDQDPCQSCGNGFYVDVDSGECRECSETNTVCLNRYGPGWWHDARVADCDGMGSEDRCVFCDGETYWDDNAQQCTQCSEANCGGVFSRRHHYRAGACDGADLRPVCVLCNGDMLWDGQECTACSEAVCSIQGASFHYRAGDCDGESGELQCTQCVPGTFWNGVVCVACTEAACQLRSGAAAHYRSDLCNGDGLALPCQVCSAGEYWTGSTCLACATSTAECARRLGSAWHFVATLPECDGSQTADRCEAACPAGSYMEEEVEESGSGGGGAECMLCAASHAECKTATGSAAAWFTTACSGAGTAQPCDICGSGQYWVEAARRCATCAGSDAECEVLLGDGGVVDLTVVCLGTTDGDRCVCSASAGFEVNVQGECSLRRAVDNNTRTTGASNNGSGQVAGGGATPTGSVGDGSSPLPIIPIAVGAVVLVSIIVIARMRRHMRDHSALPSKDSPATSI